MKNIRQSSTAGRAVLGLLLLLCVGPPFGCNTDYRISRVSPPPVDPWRPSGQVGTICVVRPQSFGAVATALHHDNRRLVGVSRGSGVYFCYRAQPGWHHLTAYTDNTAELWVNVPPAGSAFARYELRVGPDALLPLTEARARVLLPRLAFIQAVPVTPRVPAPLRVPAPARRR